MRKRTKANSDNNTKKIQKERTEKLELSSAATKAMFDQMAAISMAMGMTYGLYMPITLFGYENPYKNF